MTDVKQTAEQKAAKPNPNPAWDQFAASLQVMYAVIERTANLLDADLSKTSRRPVEESDVHTSGARIADQIARMIYVDQEISLEEKWLLQAWFRRCARFLAQNGSLFTRYIYPDPRLSNAVIASGYTGGGGGYSDPAWLRRAAILGNISRFVENYATLPAEERLVHLSGNLTVHQPGTTASLSLLVDENRIGYVEGGVQRTT